MGPFLCSLAERLNSGGAQRKPKVAKGARDFLPEQVRHSEAYEERIGNHLDIKTRQHGSEVRSRLQISLARR